MSSVAQIQAQNATARAAYTKGEISASQYNAFMAVQQQNMQKALAQQKQTQSKPSSPTGSDPATASPIKQQGSTTWINSNYEVSKKETVGNQTTITVAPKANPVDVALGQREARLNYEKNTARGGTSLPQSNVQQAIDPDKQYTFNLSAEQKQEFTSRVEAQKTERITGLGTMMVASAVAPVLGPVGAAKAVGLGIGVSQGFKTAETAFRGGDISKSLLTPQEALFAAETGVIFAGVGGGAIRAAGKVAPKVLTPITGPASMGAKATGVVGRAGVNAGVGAGGGAVFSGGDPLETAKGAAYGAGFSLGGEALTPINSRVAPRILGYKAQRVTGATEIEKSIVSPTGITSQRLTTLTTENVRLPYNYGKFVKANEKFFIPDKVEVGGTQKVFMRGGNEKMVYEKAYLSSRDANPYVMAAQGKNSLTAKGIMMEGAKAERITVTSQKAPKQVYEKTTVSKDILGPEKILTKRDLTGVQFFGDVDSQVYLNYLKNVPKGVGQDWLKQMGGLSYQQMTKPSAPQKIRVFSNLVNVAKPTIKPVTFSPYVGLADVAKASSKSASTSAVSFSQSAKTSKAVVVSPMQQSKSPSRSEMFTAAMGVSPEVSPIVSDIMTPVQSERTQPIQTITQRQDSGPKQTQTYPTPSPLFPQMKGSNYPFFPDFKMEASGPDMFLFPTPPRSRRAIRKYPVMKPKDLLRRML